MGCLRFAVLIVLISESPSPQPLVLSFLRKLAELLSKKCPVVGAAKITLYLDTYFINNHFQQELKWGKYGK